MIKNGKVEIGKTPSEESGKESTIIKKGMALIEGEECENPVEEIVKILDAHIKEDIEKGEDHA